MPGSVPERGLRPPHRAGASRWPLAALIAAVLLAHLLLADGLLKQQMGWGAGDRPAPRIEVAFVRALEAAVPAPVLAPAAPARVPARLPALAAKPKPAASAAAAADAEPAAAKPPAEPLTVAAAPAALASADPAAESPMAQVDRAPATAAPVPDPSPLAVAQSQPAAPASVPAPAAAAASAARFDWPPSTRLSYRLSGFYRGSIEGSAQVEWLRQGSRYQVRMATSIGPVLSRHISSEGELTEAGLAPRRFDGEQKVLFRAARRWSLRFGPERIVLTDGRELATLPGAQDEASQFVQLTWLFTTRPDQLRVGQSIELPLIVGRTLERWTYDVVAEELLQFPFGAVPTFHVKPRREAKGGDMTAEIWFAPSLQTLPVRILIRQSQDSWVDLTLDSPPMQAAEPAALR